MKLLWAVVVAGAWTALSANAAPAHFTASEALGAAERLCALPKEAEFVRWAVISSDEAGNPSPAARTGIYWVVHGRYNLPGDDAIFDLLLPVPKMGPLPKGCSIVPSPHIDLQPRIKNSN
jgi:hypothetical protein